MMKARLGGEVYDEGAYDARVRNAVFETVAKQVECGIDIVADGEQSKPGFFTYVRERLSGFESRPAMKVPFYEAEVAAFPEYYKEYFARAMGGGAVAPLVPTVCIGPVSYIGREALARDIQNLKDALVGQNVAGAFMPSVAPSGAGLNEHYRTDEEYYQAVGSALREEYKAIVDAGFYLQIDDPFLSDVYSDLRYDDAQKKRKAGLFVEALNHALNGIPDEMVRFHTCYGINEGPRIFDAKLKDVVGHMLKVKARFYSFEGANARHEHEYHVWESIRLPAGKVLIPGVITHASNIVEHPELIAERLVRYAKIVGGENVIASADCGFSSQACYKTEVHPKVIWEKFKALAEGARLASKQI
ncbi:MAG TPA: cobalamin-independent methionine synthase II family protein [Pseudolabrys sp.]|nr:cobalamin-independent methionine synthase II family protein [Pseudolabrys sp.]